MEEIHGKPVAALSKICSTIHRYPIFSTRYSVMCKDGWMDDLRFYVLFNSISVISGQCLDDNERLCAMKLRLRLRRFHLERGSNSVR